MLHIRNSYIYRDRQTESELCRDFPGDALLIDGLYAMQMHFLNNNIQIRIPIVRIMNTAHFMAAYMFSTTCSGDQMEYDIIATDNLGRDTRLSRVALIVLAAMLRQTNSTRAAICRQLILANHPFPSA